MRGSINQAAIARSGVAILVATVLSGCVIPGQSTVTGNTSTGRTSGTALTYPTGARAARIIFSSNATGSFDAAPAGGGSLDAVRIYDTSNALLASGDVTSATWPKWLSKVSIGISGVNNAGATHADCARFAIANEETTQCDLDGDGAFNDNCGASLGLYRVSEYDCAAGTATAGIGNSSDGVFVRAVFNRNSSYLASHENIMVVVEYAAGSVNKVAADPTACFTAGGVFAPTNTNCADHSWQMFLLDSAAATGVQPFVTLVPPFFGQHANTGKRGAAVMTRQFILPLAGSASTTVMQISRMDGVGTAALTRCNAAPPGSANSPMCSGMTFFSMTFYRL